MRGNNNMTEGGKMYPNTIKSWTVRQVGCTAWKDGIRTEKAARRHLREARDNGIRAQLWAEHKDGSTTGPY